MHGSYKNTKTVSCRQCSKIPFPADQPVWEHENMLGSINGPAARRKSVETQVKGEVEGTLKCPFRKTFGTENGLLIMYWKTLFKLGLGGHYLRRYMVLYNFTLILRNEHHHSVHRLFHLCLYACCVNFTIIVVRYYYCLV